jgi:hypothetical protein
LRRRAALIRAAPAWEGRAGLWKTPSFAGRFFVQVTFSVATRQLGQVIVLPVFLRDPPLISSRHV